jgi:flagellin-like protein
MKRNQNITAVSPVIGVIIMVALTVILAAVVGVFAFGLGDRVKEPGATAGVTTNSEIEDTGFAGGFDPVASFKHMSGDKIRADNIRIEVYAPSGSATIFLNSTNPEGYPSDGTCESLAYGACDAVIENDDSVLRSPYNTGYVIPAEYKPGEQIRIPFDEDGAGLDTGGSLQILLIDEESEVVMVKEEFSASDF